MKFMIVLVSVLGATIAKPSIGHANFIQDGGSFSYSYQTPVVHSLVHQARYVQAVPALAAVPVAHSASVVVGPSVRYSYGAVPIAVKNVEPANIQLSSDGFVLDTEEVAKARAEHLATVAQESARAAASGNDESEGIVIEDADSVEVAAPIVAAAPVIAAKSQINFQPANIQLSSDGHVLDTPEVAQAKADHLARFAAESAKSSHSFSYSAPNYVSYNAAPIVAAHYVTPVAKAVEIANIQVSSDGHVLDTPEVAQAKADHLARFAAESAKSSQSISYSAPSFVSYNAAPIVAAPYVTPVAKAVEIANIQVSSDGHVLDTPEVAQAKADHLARFAAESAKASHSIAYSAPSYAAYNYVQAAPKAVEIANIQISADGHVLDTPEVAQAKAAHFAQYNSDAARAAAAGDDTESYNESDDSSSQQGDSVSIVALRGQAVAGPLVQYKVEDAPADIKVSSDGFVLDTPEVAQAKSAHLAEIAKSASVSSQGAVVAYSAPSTAASYVAYTSPALAYTGSAIAYAQPKWIGPEADIRVGSDGFVQDTPEVQQARAEHLATRASIMANSQSSWSGAASRYASAAHAGQYIQDTAEVAAARVAHLQAHAAEAAKATSSVKSYNYGRLVYSAPVYHTAAPSFSYIYSSPSYKLLNYRYAPTAAPVALTPDGQFLLDTPEVAAAKAEHFSAHARARGY